MNSQTKSSKEAPVNNLSRRFSNPITGGAIGFGIGFIVVGMISTLIMWIESRTEFAGIFPVLLHSAIALSLQSAVGGGIGGILLGWSLPLRQRLLVAVATALGIGLGELLTIYLSVRIGKQFFAGDILLGSLVIRSILMGVLVGTFICLVGKSWKYMGQFAILGIIGFTIYHLLIYWLSPVIPVSAFSGNSAIQNLIMSVVNGIGGMVVGACLGVSFAKSIVSEQRT